MGAALIALTLTVAACAGTSRGAGSQSPSYSGTWALTDGRGPGGEIPLVQGYRITLEIAAERIGGTAGCNSYGGEGDIDGDSFSLKGLAMTEVACSPQVMDSEDAYIDALSAADTIVREGDTLILTGPDTELRFELSPPPLTTQLTDTRWQLESLIEGGGAEATASSAAPARLILRSDGTLAGSTGCRKLEGEWIERGDEILLTELGAEGDCPADLEEQDGHVLQVLGDGFTAEIEEQRLVLLSKGDLGLSYVAESQP